MATLLHNALRNVAWRMESISCSSTDLCQNEFREIDPTKVDREEGSALERKFTVSWLSRSADHYVTDSSEINSHHRAELIVIYGPWRSWKDSMELVARDQFDIAQKLRRDTYYLGVSADDTTADTGFSQRTIEEMTLDTSDGDVWYLRIVLGFRMREQA
jgi:hypothetical protein